MTPSGCCFLVSLCHLYRLSPICKRFIVCRQAELRAGVKPTFIRCYLEYAPGQQVDQLFTQLLQSSPIHPNSLLTDLQTLNAKAVVFCCTGHGSPIAIDGVFPLRPVPLVTGLRSVPGVEQVVIVLGQCFAGIFDYLEIQGAPTTVIAGATKLHESISYGGLGLTFQANIFLAYFFSWVSNPVDTDGDGIFTIADAYKNAAIFTNDTLRRLKGDLTKTYDQWCLKEQAALPLIQDPVQKADKEEEIRLKASIYHTHQEPWMLNAYAARNVLFK